MDFETAYYIVNYFPRLLSANETAALRHYNAMFKIGTQDRYKTIVQYKARLQWHRDRNNLSDNPEILNLLDNGLSQFYINAASRIIQEKREKIYFNNCPNCNQLARTPYARQCKHCGHSWHNTIAAHFKVNKVFGLQLRPKHLFLAGVIHSGLIKEGMVIDLTFLGISLKPVIESIGFLDDVSNAKADLTIGVTIEGVEEREYLKESGILATPIIIEKGNFS